MPSSQNLNAVLPFTKMQALGNDFVIVEACDVSTFENDRFSGIARLLCDRHFGIGADGLIVVNTPKDNQCQLAWTFVNADGSCSAMCGNGLRCLALWAQGRSKVTGSHFFIETDIGPVEIQIDNKDQITCDLKAPLLASHQIPVLGGQRAEVVHQEIEVSGKRFFATCVSMGNPHCVIFEPSIAESEYEIYAPAIQKLDFFPQGVNVEFVQVISGNLAKVFVWERGVGKTLACASGAAAVCVAGVLEARLERNVQVVMPGGALLVSWSAEDNHVRLTGPAQEIYNGVFDLNTLWTGAIAARLG